MGSTQNTWGATSQPNAKKASNMSYGGMASTGLILGSMCGTLLASKWVHDSIIGSGTQPTTMSAEFKAAEMTRGLAKPCQSVEGKTMMQNPVFNSSFDFATGRSAKFMAKPREPISVVGVAEE